MTLLMGEDLTNLHNSYEQINFEKCIIRNSDQGEDINEFSPPFFENMLLLIFKKIS